MRKLLHTALCAALLAAALTVSSFAAEQEPPAMQGDFHVLVNGQYVTFPDAVPRLKDGRSYLPFVAVFGQLGFAEEDMTWDASTATVTAVKEGVTIRLTEGSTVITVDRDGEVTQYQTDAAPYIDAATSRTYIPFGLAAEVLGYNVGWDAQTGTVIIDDVDAILAANAETYELMDRYLDYSRPFAEHNQQVTLDYTMDMGVAGLMESEGQQMDLDFSFQAQGQGEMITSGNTALEFDTQMGLGMSLILDGLDLTQLAGAMGGLPALPESVDFSMRGDLAQGSLYFRSDLLDQMAGQTGTEDTWYRMDLSDLTGEMSAMTGMDYAAMLQLSADSLDMSFAEQLEQVLRSLEPTSVQFTAGDCLDQINALCADSAFTRSGSGYVNTFRLSGEDGSGAAQEFTGTFTLYTSGSRVTGYALEGTSAFSQEETGAVSMSLSASMKNNQMEMVMDYTISGEGSTVTLNMTMGGLYRSTSASPETQPPEGAAVVDLSQEDLTALSA